MLVMNHAIEFGNWVMMLCGVGLMGSGPLIIYRTVQGVKKLRKIDPKASVQPFNNGLNILFGIVFFIAGILFILNNLRGNPLN